jgi:16S rRNA (guanine966-N2)-methyltransferase
MGDVRLTAGEFKGRSLQCPEAGVRPMLNRTRMALFNVLGDSLRGTTVWDCFAGSGLLGFECLSRGAGHVVFVEKAPVHARTLQANIDALGVRARTGLIRGSIFELVRPGTPPLPHTPAGLLLLDPPHAMIIEQPGQFWPWFASLHETSLAGPNTLAAIGHPSDLKFPHELGNWTIQQTRFYGSVAFTILDG